jgi:integrase
VSTGYAREPVPPELPEGIDRRPSGRYRARASWKGRSVSRTFATLPAAVRWRAEALDALRAGSRPPGPLPVVAPRALHTVEDTARALGRGIRAGTVRSRNGMAYKPSVSRRMESSLREHVIPRIGSIPAEALTRREVQRLVDDVAAERTPETARKALNALSVALRVAERDGVIERNPAYDIRVPQSGEGERPARILTPEEAEAIVAAAVVDDERLQRSLGGPLLALAFGSGMRLGELLALRWGPHGDESEGLDLTAGTVRIRWALDRVRHPDTGEYPRVRPKSRAGIRDVPLDPADVTLLKRHHLAAGRPVAGALVFAQPGGAPLTPTGQPVHAWRRAVKAAKIPDPRPRLHDTRHAWAVAMLRAGVVPAAPELYGRSHRSGQPQDNYDCRRAARQRPRAAPASASSSGRAWRP